MSPCRNDYITVSILETPPVSIPLGTYANRYPLSPWVLSLVDEPFFYRQVKGLAADCLKESFPQLRRFSLQLAL